MREARGVSLPWSRAPRAALSSKLTPIIAGVTALLSCFLATSAVLIASAAGGAATDYQAAVACPDTYGPVFSRTSLPAADAPAVIDTVRRQAAAHGFPQPVAAMYTGAFITGIGAGPGRKYTIAYRDGALDHLRQLQRGGGPGLWIGDDLSRLAPVKPGDVVAGGRLPAVAGIYHALSVPPPRWWCSQQHDATVYVYANDPLNTIAFASDQRTFDDVVRDVHPPALANLSITFYLDPPRTPEQASAYLDRSRELIAAVNADLSRQGLAGSLAAQTPFARSVELAGQAQSNVLVSILPLAVISVLVGCGGIAVVALQWYQRRHAQVRLLAARGAGPPAIGGLAVAELGLPVLAGGIVGIVLARLSVPWYAPPGEVAWGRQLAAGGIALGVLGVALVLLAVVSAMRAHREFQVGRMPRRGVRARLLAFFPWELATAGLALFGWTRLAGYGATSRVGTPLPQINPLALTYPVFVVLTAGLVAARLVWLLLRASHRLRLWSRPPLQLAIRRLAGARAPVT
ncbi:ABC transporter permease, partial [Amycolatopsis alkalitolerans]